MMPITPRTIFHIDDASDCHLSRADQRHRIVEILPFPPRCLVAPVNPETPDATGKRADGTALSSGAPGHTRLRQARTPPKL